MQHVTIERTQFTISKSRNTNHLQYHESHESPHNTTTCNATNHTNHHTTQPPAMPRITLITTQHNHMQCHKWHETPHNTTYLQSHESHESPYNTTTCSYTCNQINPEINLRVTYLYHGLQSVVVWLHVIMGLQCPWVTSRNYEWIHTVL